YEQERVRRFPLLLHFSCLHCGFTVTKVPNKPKRKLRRVSIWLSFALVIIVGALLIYLQSDSFRERMRRQIVSQLEYVTGGKVELKTVNWSLRKLQFDVQGLTIRGLEKSTDVPYAHVDSAHFS